MLVTADLERKSINSANVEQRSPEYDLPACIFSSDFVKMPCRRLSNLFPVFDEKRDGKLRQALKWHSIRL